MGKQLNKSCVTLVDDTVAEIMLAAQEEAVAAALSKDSKTEEEGVVDDAPAEANKADVAEDGDGIYRVLFNSKNQ